MAPGPARNPAAQPVARVVGARWRDLAPRVASAMMLGPIVLAAGWQGGIYWQALLTLAATVALLEWASLCALKLDGTLTLAAAASVPAAQAAYLATGRRTAPVAIIAAFAAVLAWRHRLLGAGVLYVGAGYLGLLLLRTGPGGLANLVFLLLVVWANDIGAYLAGRLIGGRRMAPRLSPGKTWAGAGGGLVFSSPPASPSPPGSAPATPASSSPKPSPWYFPSWRRPAIWPRVPSNAAPAPRTRDT